MFTPYITGLGTGAGLIIAIGSQNAFVLTQGIKKQYRFTVALICFLCDAVLISAGVAGLGGVITAYPLLITGAALSGSAFLFVYGALQLRAALRGGEGLEESRSRVFSRREVILTTVTITLLNPHVYLDTVVLLGSISGTFSGAGRYLFGAGAVTMSAVWFFGLSLGAGFLAPLFRKPGTWRVFSVLICVIMWLIAYKLLLFSGVLALFPMG